MKGDHLASCDGPAIVDEAIVETQAAEGGRVDELRVGEVPTGEVDVADGAVEAAVADLHAVGRHAGVQARRGALVHRHELLRLRAAAHVHPPRRADPSPATTRRRRGGRAGVEHLANVILALLQRGRG